MTYTEFKNQFETEEQFEWVFGNLLEEEARELIANEEASTTVKACMLQKWRSLHEKNVAILGEDFFKKIDPEDEKFLDDCEKVQDYLCIDDYKRDIKRWLVLSSWRYSESQAEDIINTNMHFITDAFEKKEPVGDIGAEVGFGCG